MMATHRAARRKCSRTTPRRRRAIRSRAIAGELQSKARRQLALACLLFTVTAATVLLVPDVLEFSWRYQLPAVVLLPPAGVLGFGAILSGCRARTESKSERMIAMSDVAWVPGAVSESTDSA